MEIIFSRLYKIDIGQKLAIENSNYQNKANFKSYIFDLLQQIIEKKPDRFYKFRSETTEVRNLMTKILFEKEYDNSCKSIANRLLEKEILAQLDLDKKKLKKQIQRGMLIVSLINMTETENKFVVLKVDYDEFISEITGEIESGFSLRKKMYKAFVSELNNEYSVLQTLVFDSNSISSAYWWDKFLELDVETTDEENTTRAFDAIETAILKPLEKKHKADFFHLWNSTIRYFRAKEEFILEDYIENGIGDYLAYDEQLNINELKDKIRNLPETHKDYFDRRFTIVKEKVTKRLKTTIPLTEQIDLHLKQDIPNPKATFDTDIKPDGSKYVIIKSALGYEYFKNILKDGK